MLSNTCYSNFRYSLEITKSNIQGVPKENLFLRKTFIVAVSLKITEISLDNVEYTLEFKKSNVQDKLTSVLHKWVLINSRRCTRLVRAFDK